MHRLPGFPAFLVSAALAFSLSLPASPAKADSFFFGISGGDRHRHYGHRHHHKHWHHRHHHHSHGPRYWSGYHHYYRPPIIVAPPPVVYHAPPPVVYTDPPVISAVPSSPVYQAANGQYCREYQGTVTVNGRSQPSYGTACLMPDGSWRVVN